MPEPKEVSRGLALPPKFVTQTAHAIGVNKALDGRIMFQINKEIAFITPPEAIRLSTQVLKFCGVRLDIGVEQKLGDLK